MAGLEHLSAAVIPLCVAFLNLLIAGHSLAGSNRDRTRLAFGAAPAGVGIWAVAWFISVLDVTGPFAMQLVGSFGGVIAMLGFALDGLGAVGQRPRRALLGLAGLSALMALVGAVLLGEGLSPLVVAGALARAAALGLLLLTALTELLRLRASHGAERITHRRILVVLAVSTGGYLAFATAALLDGRQGVDPLLLVALSAECLALLFIVERRVEIRIVLTRAVAYAALSVVVTAFAALAFKLTDARLDLRELALALGVSLFSVLLFVGLGEVLAAGVERVLFPGRARLSSLLDVSRGEVASLRRRLERVERLAIAGELAASVAHEIKNPLSPIRGYAQLLSQRLEQVPEADRPFFEKGLRIIQEEVDRIDRRVRDLLELSRQERSPTAQPPEVDLNQVALEVIAVAEAEPLIHGISQRFGAGPLTVRADPDELRGALANLMKNAVEALEPVGGGLIQVETRREGDHVIAEIVDDGVGLTSAESDRAFDAFYTTKKGGTGLGLAIARSAIEAAGGRVELRGRSDARGAIARVDLPRSLGDRPSPPEEKIP